MFSFLDDNIQVVLGKYFEFGVKRCVVKRADIDILKSIGTDRRKVVFGSVTNKSDVLVS